MCKPIIAAALFCAALTVRGQEPDRSSWDCLPANTAVALRVPNGKAAFDKLRTTTKAGAVIFDDDRMDTIRQMIHENEEWLAGEKKLATYGLSPEDLVGCLTGETGMAVVLDDSDDEALWVGLGWVEPGDELAGRLRDSIAQFIEKQDAEPRIMRTDIEIDNREVMLLAVPETNDERLELPENFDELSEEQQKKWMLAVGDADDDTSVSYTQLLLSQHNGRMLVAVAMDASEDPEPRARISRLTAVFADFLLAHDGEPGSFASRIESLPAVRDALPQDGEVFVEIYGDIRPVLSAVDAADAKFDTAKLIKTLGVDRLGVMAARMSLGESLLKTGAFLENPAPRTGIMTLFDQPALDPEPPDWVPSSVFEYVHLSLDLGKLYQEIKTVAIANVGNQADAQFQKVEAQVNALAGTDLATLLSSVGHRHTVVSFEPRMRNVQISDEEQMEMLSERMAVVWQIQDEALWKRLLQASQGFAAMAGDAVKFGSAQGFEGYRIITEAMEGGLYLGKGYLVLGVGQDVIDQTLSLLNNPPQGTDALRNGERFNRAADSMQLEAGLMFEFADNTRYANMMGQFFEQFLEDPKLFGITFGQQDADPEDVERFTGQIRSLMPTDDELTDIFGISTGYLRATPAGVEMKNVSELPR